MEDNIHHYTKAFIDQCDRVSPDYFKGCVESFQRMFDKNNDAFRWKLLKSNKHLGFKVMLDNDETTVVFCPELMEDRCVEDWSGKFDAWIGNSPGISDLLDSIEIPNERY